MRKKIFSIDQNLRLNFLSKICYPFHDCLFYVFLSKKHSIILKRLTIFVIFNEHRFFIVEKLLLNLDNN